MRRVTASRGDCGCVVYALISRWFSFGAGRAVVEQVAARRPRRVVHVACDPAALARDIALFRERGYRLAELEAFDAFPMTHHIECIALLEHDAEE